MTYKEIAIQYTIVFTISLLIGWGAYSFFNIMDNYPYYVVGCIIAGAFLIGRDIGRKQQKQ